ncbi:MAG: rRNA maturation RNase YbeY [Alphaproteobacteria bacterium]|jgi:probable rRNA maturation factor|nr:rRNA maturation RNase YbeY [Rickettsiaceae bacterium]NBY35593.1 rRNA maturation RNase YbeY [Alphaproteobacteria bacterium]UCM94450.1 MAG: rRNA maturation RNase YbeY [Candidatus Megaira endosymbiont of Mesostigma viride]HJK85984.1 rRNA maturation RNase YbeY [Candidatus Megaera endosymbiont of Stentor roeselii]HJK88645.1 rRNA maturation RNase YbeY [Candidatus Megaira endosymbiont of Mesostigma viride]
MKFTIEIAQDNDEWDSYKEINPKLFEEILEEVLTNYPNFNKVQNIELSILLTNDKRIKKLNQEFRNENSATNVLSFPDLDIDFSQILEFKPDLDYIYLGDIAFAFETISEEVKKKNIPFLNHFKHLLVHSTLHLLGYDHMNDTEAEIMQDIEVKILKKLSIPSPYL